MARLHPVRIAALATLAVALFSCSAKLSHDVMKVFGGPQDTEWAIHTDGKLLLFQSRPITTEIRGVPRGPIYGPGPVAETFPEPLTELEQDLWVPPLRDAEVAGAEDLAQWLVANAARPAREPDLFESSAG